MEGPSSGNGYIRDFETQAQSPQITSVAAQEQAPGTLSAGVRRARQGRQWGGHATPAGHLQHNSLIPYRRQEVRTDRGSCSLVARKRPTGVVSPRTVKHRVVCHPEGSEGPHSCLRLHPAGMLRHAEHHRLRPGLFHLIEYRGAGQAGRHARSLDSHAVAR